MLPRRERNTDLADRQRRRELSPVRTIAIQRQTASEKTSQALVDEVIQKEQQELKPVIKVQDVPGEVVPEGLSKLRISLPPFVDNIENVIKSVPVKSINPVKVVPQRTTISGVLKERMGVANIRARTRRGAVPGRVKAISIPVPAVSNAFGTDTKEKIVVDTPVIRLTFLDQIFNWINAIFS